MSSELSIGAVSGATGIARTALRYYEEIGIIAPVRRVGGQRRFSLEVIDQLKFVTTAKAAGFSLDEIRELIGGESEWRDLVEGRLGELRDEKRRLERQISALEEAMHCDCQVPVDCGVAAGDSKLSAMVGVPGGQ